MIVDQDQLMKLAELSSKAALRKHLKRAGIPFGELNGKLYTTVDAMTARLVGRGQNKKPAEPNWDAIN
jgi:hypothetical protein